MEKIIPTEHAEQVALIQWWEIKKLPPIFAIPNGGHRHKATAIKLKLEGVRPGVPDLYCPALRLWIEMKRQKGGRLSPEQKEWRDYLLSIGDRWIAAKGAKDAINQLEKLMPL